MNLLKILVRCWLLVAASAAVAGDEFYLNVCCQNGNYRLARFGADGLQNPPTPVVDGSNIGSGMISAAWPSALKVGSETWLYSSRHNGRQWHDVGLWKSADGGLTFKLHGSVFAPNASEPQGIGPAQVFYDGSSARPFKMIYLVRGTPVGTTLRLADSTDGQNWTRVGDVLTSTEPFEATGVSPSWVFQNENGEWVLLYHAYESLDKAHAAIAYAPSLGTPFANKKIIYSPDGKQHAVSGALKSSNVATVSGTVLIGQPHVLRANDGSAMEPVIPVKQVGTTVYFDRPLLAAYPSGTMASVLRNKVDPSYVVKEADGTYMAYFTGYGQFPGVLSEYTARFRSPALTGPWTAAKDGFGFQPWAPDSILSTENPAAVIQAQ